jgi:hypothetical protein
MLAVYTTGGVLDVWNNVDAARGLTGRDQRPVSSFSSEPKLPAGNHSESWKYNVNHGLLDSLSQYSSGQDSSGNDSPRNDMPCKFDCIVDSTVDIGALELAFDEF